MAEFCSKCTSNVPDIDVMKEFDQLENGYCSSGWICEGCGLIVIGKTEDGKLQVIRIKPEGEDNSTWEDF